MEILRLRDKEKKLIAGLTKYKDLCIESVLDTGDKTLSFSYPKEDKFYELIEEEGYIERKDNEYVIKSKEINGEYVSFTCVLNLEDLEGKIVDRFESIEQNINSTINLAIVGTGWTVKDNTLKKKRTVRCTNKNALEIVQEIKKTYRVDIVFNTLEKQIEIYEHLGADKGAYFIDSLNLTALQIQSDSYKFATRIIAEGKDGLTFADINGGKNYVENYQYSNKVKTIYWKDERYTVKENLLADAKAKLEGLSKPFRSYSASILNLAELNPKYKNILDFKLGDAINLISKDNKVKDKQRIVKTVEWPQDHTKDTVELANATLKFEDIQQENQETTDTVSNITVDNGTLDSNAFEDGSIKVKKIENFEANVLKVAKLEVIEARIDHLSAVKADIQDLNAVKANIGTLEATKANITELNAIKANLEQAIIKKANITDLNAVVGKINVLESKTASIDNLLAGNLTADNFKANSIVAGSGIIADGAIGSAQISSLSVNKLEAGDITTSKHKIVSADGTIEIVGNQILINRNNINRVILGEYRRADGTTDYGLVVRALDGQTIMLDGRGVHNAGITDGAIDNNKVADNANIAGNKLDINSVIREVNGSTETIKGTKIQVGDRTLDIELSIQKNTITEHGQELSTQKASIQALDNAIKLKVDTQTFTQSTQTINSNINRAKEEAINESRSILDTRKDNQNPEWYMSNYPRKTISEFKYANVIGIPNAKANYGVLETKIPWDNPSGGYPTQVFRGNNYPTYQRKAVSNTSWGEWEQIEDTQGSQDKANSALNNAKEYINSEITIVNRNLSKATTEINLLKGEINLKVNQTDIDKTIKTIEDKIKVTTEKITTVESSLTEKTNSIEASVRELNSTTQTITNNVSNINRDLTNKINSNLDIAKNFATDMATSKANNALNNAKAYTNAEITTVNTKVHNVESNLNILSDRINTKVSQSDIDKSISNIQLGGRNYVRYSNFPSLAPATNNIKGWNAWGDISVFFNQGKPNYNVNGVAYLAAIEGGGIWQEIKSDLIKPNEDYTLSLLLGQESNVRDCPCYIEFWNNDVKVKAIWLFGNTGYLDLKRRSYTFKTINEPYTSIRLVFVHNGSSDGNGCLLQVGLIKLEKGNKAGDWTIAIEDTDQLIGDNIKIVNSKISDVSSSVTQLKDSVTTQINSINSKTQSIESNLNGKASKQEVTDVNNRVTTIKASLDGITQRVSATESKTQTLEHNINDKASKQEVVNITSRIATVETNLNGITSRVSSTETFTKSLNDKLWETTNKLNNVEQQITPTSIINMVSSSYYQKGEANNLFSTKSEVEQLDNRINYKFSNTGYSNLIFNGNFANGTVHWRNWGNCSLVAENGQLLVRAKQSAEKANMGAVSSTFVLEKGKKYSLSFQGASCWNIPWLNYIYLLGEDGVNYRLDLNININSADLVYRTATFTAPETKWVRLLIGIEGYLQTDISGFKLVDVCLVEGDIPRRFIPNANEISEGSTSIDSNGVIVRHSNDSYTSMTHGGFEWKTKGMSKAYHCLAETGWVNISTGAWLGDHYDIKITLPEYFKGKVFTPCSMIQGWYVESNFSLNQLVVNIPWETINYSEGSFVIRVKALTRDGEFQRNINISWLAIA